MLQPKRTRYRKHHKPPHVSPTNNTSHLCFGDYGIQACVSGRVTARHLEAIRRVCTRVCRRQGKIWIRVFPDWSVTRKSAESRMGKGKGAPSFWVCPVPAGTLLVELSGMPQETARRAAYLAGFKLSIPTRFVTRHGIAG